MRFKLDPTIGDYIFVTRPTLFFPVWTIFLVGYLIPYLKPGNWWLPFSATVSGDLWSDHTISIGVLLTLLCGGIFILNQIQDVVSDGENNKLFIIANGYISRRAAYIEATLLISIALGLTLFINWYQTILFMLLFLIAGWAYSFPPFNCKDKPLPGLFSNALTGLFVFSIGWCLREAISTRLFQHALTYLLAISTVYLYTTIPDRRGDAKAGKITFSVKFGQKKTTFLALWLGVGALWAAYWAKDWLMLIATIISLPFFIKVYLTQKMSDLSFATKLPILFLSLAVCWKIPYYFFVILLVFWGARWYYRARFNLNYPRFSN